MHILPCDAAQRYRSCDTYPRISPVPFDGAVKSAKVGPLTPHELRHTAASLAVSAGASVLALQRMLGHDKPSTTLDVYSDLFDEDLDAVADRLADTRKKSRADYLRTKAESQADPKSLKTS